MKWKKNILDDTRKREKEREREILFECLSGIRKGGRREKVCRVVENTGWLYGAIYNIYGGDDDDDDAGGRESNQIETNQSTFFLFGVHPIRLSIKSIVYFTVLYCTVLYNAVL
jgi:hypothetical protein